MSYITFIDMIGTRASAMLNNQEYTDAINDFNNSLRQVSYACKCKVYGYSDNAYAEIDNLTDMITFFRILRDNLMKNHRYFTAAVDQGSLHAEQVRLNNNSFSMKFTAPSTTDIYIKQCQYSGIGILLSNEVVEDMRKQKMESDFCQSIFQKHSVHEKEAEFVSVFDISYKNVILEKIEYLISDYLITAATNDRASRYYITPIISMIKCLNKDIITNELTSLISLLSFKNIPDAFEKLPRNKEYSLFFMFALIDFILSLRETNKSIDAIKNCEQVIKEYNISYPELIKKLPSISTAVISNINKRHFLNILYNIK